MQELKKIFCHVPWTGYRAAVPSRIFIGIMTTINPLTLPREFLK
jgi:hypothetical protein